MVAGMKTPVSMEVSEFYVISRAELLWFLWYNFFFIVASKILILTSSAVPLSLWVSIDHIVLSPNLWLLSVIRILDFTSEIRETGLKSRYFPFKVQWQNLPLPTNIEF